MLSRRNDDTEAVRLPAEVIERLATTGVPKAAVAIRKAEGVDMPLTTRGCIALADRMDAERRVIESAAKLDAAREELIAIEDLRVTVNALQKEARELRDANASLRKEIEQLIAKDAMAISSTASR